MTSSSPYAPFCTSLLLWSSLLTQLLLLLLLLFTTVHPGGAPDYLPVISLCVYLQESNLPKTTCILQDVTPGTYAIEVSIFLSHGWKTCSIVSSMQKEQRHGSNLDVLTPQLRDDNNTTRRQTQYHVSQGKIGWPDTIRSLVIPKRSLLIN